MAGKACAVSQHVHSGVPAFLQIAREYFLLLLEGLMRQAGVLALPGTRFAVGKHLHHVGQEQYAPDHIPEGTSMQLPERPAFRLQKELAAR